MEVRTFYWDAAKPQPAPRSPLRRLFKSKPDFTIGNAGDLFNRDLVRYLYGADAANIETGGNRLLFVGSVAHRASERDIVCGIGTKGARIPTSDEVSLEIRGVRGPITLAAFRDAGHDVSNVRFEFDPGLLVGEVFASEPAPDAEKGRVAFIPHYRDRSRFRSNRDYDVIDIDCTASTLRTEILRSEFVYSSSLHGIVFAHALGRPCMLVAPVNGEAPLKYQDYFASVGLAWSTPDDLDSALTRPKPASPFTVPVDLADFSAPSLAELTAGGYAA